jgi:hypothetical protein
MREDIIITTAVSVKHDFLSAILGSIFISKTIKKKQAILFGCGHIEIRIILTYVLMRLWVRVSLENASLLISVTPNAPATG